MFLDDDLKGFVVAFPHTALEALAMTSPVDESSRAVPIE
jgi:hypothetical protein